MRLRENASDFSVEVIQPFAKQFFN